MAPHLDMFMSGKNLGLNGLKSQWQIKTKEKRMQIWGKNLISYDV